MINNRNHQYGLARASLVVGVGIPPERGGIASAEAFDEAAATPQQIAAGNQVRRLRHDLQLALMDLKESACTDAQGLATPADIAWVQDQVIERPYMAQVVNRWFRSVRRLSQEQVRGLRMVAQLIAQIEELAPADERGLARYRTAVTPTVHSDA
ncbi:hypothetical protein [uncultured Stenotrophomonas sp.]|uniref:hypothetical protein n=1 Tax=uncultured Stenotrophomonas sp. TaxID=165438 RepID=UPI0025ED8169|nr:hypothetical protein [uncultured Stenotrophomonas sp.]